MKTGFWGGPVRKKVIAFAAGATLLTGLPLLGSNAVSKPPVPEQYRHEEPAAETWSPARAALGKRLFHERRLSRNETVACSDCHRAELAFTDGRPTAQGVRGQVGHRNTPTLVNRGLAQLQFWDGRAASLEEQALGPIANPGEMDLPIPEAVARLNADASYRAEFQRTFGGPPTAESLAVAIASYERTLYSVDAPFDRFLAGDADAMTPAAKRGLALFGGKAKCSECHSGVNFSDERFHCIGLPGDPGRGAISGVEIESGAFKTPTLREINRTAPYMHDGSMSTLAKVVDYYDVGGTPHVNLDAKMKPLRLTPGEKQDLIAFMEALSGKEMVLPLPEAGE